MNWAQFVVETAASVTESWVIVSAVTEMSGRRFTSQKHHLAAAGLALIMAVVTSIFNPLRVFSFFSVAITIITAYFLTGFISKGTGLFRWFSVMLVYLAVVSADYMVLFLFNIIGGIKVSDTTYFSRFGNFSSLRCWFLAANKGAVLLLYFLLKKQLHKLRRIHENFLAVLSAILIFAHIVTPAIMSLVWSDLIFALQTAIICSWLIILVCVCVALCFSVLTSKYQDEKMRNDLLNICSSMMEENYQRLYSNQQATARLVHDINHHMGVLRDLSLQHGDGEIYGYIDSLLRTHYKELPMCRSGNDIINAIINCKIGEAAQDDIEFRFTVDTDVPDSFPPEDLCAILANQIDNAFDACRKIDDHSRRSVDVRIWQKGDNLFLFQVSNTVEKNPLIDNPQLNSTKADRSWRHGIGIRSIKEAAEKYGGALESSYREGRFYSTVFLSL